jgi:hypothetical protein
MSHETVHQEYSSRTAARKSTAELLSRRDRALSNARLGTFALTCLFAWFALGLNILRIELAVVPLVAFIWVVILHDRTLNALREAQRAEEFYADGLRRLEDRWQGHGETGRRYADPDHLYAEDLDIFGRGSVYELLCTARTRAGQDTLAHWLLAAAVPVTARTRQSAVEELRPALDARETLASLGSDMPVSVEAEQITAWGAQPIDPVPGWAQLAAWLLAAGNVIGAALWVVIGNPLPLLGSGVVSAFFMGLFGARAARELRMADKPARDLRLFALMLEQIERASFSTDLLTKLQLRLRQGGLPPSRQIGKLHTLLQMLDSQRNIVFMPVAALLLWPAQIGFAMQRWRAENGARIASWIGAVGEFEALNALAGYAYEHPDDPFPEFVEAGPILVAEGIAHPLLPMDEAIRNDVRFGGELRLLMVSGSNMSGKSTLMRSVGVNVVLAQAGAPVRARSLRLSPLAVGASLRTQDSLQEGKSRFYAEIVRLRQIVALADGGEPVLFLLDEILQGTNSHDRRIGAEGIVRGLLDRGAIGFVTTHDLALADIAEALAPAAINVHFEDHLEEGKLTFDYTLRPGVVRKSNALELMRAIGLEV